MLNAKYFLTLLLLVAFSTSAYSIRCNSRLVKEGDPGDKFRAVCGHPSQIDTRVIYRTVTIQNGTRRVANNTGDLTVTRSSDNTNASGIGLSNTQAIQVEEWHYNFGPRRLMYKVVFENGIAQSVESLGYGY